MTQTAMILHALQRGEKLTPLSALKKYGTLRLGARIFDLRKAGESIAREMIEVGDGKHVAQYRLIKQAGKAA